MTIYIPRSVEITMDGQPLFEDAYPRFHRAEITEVAEVTIQLSRPRMALEAITVCCVCDKPIEPSNQAEFDAAESLGVHLGECWNQYKRRTP